MQAGIYAGTLTKAIMSYAKSGNPQVELRFNLTNYQDGATWAEIAPTERTIYLSLSGGAKPYTKDKLESLGFPAQPEITQDPATGEALLSLPDGIGDEAVSLKCSEGFKPDGTAREEWDLASWGGAKAKPVEEADILKFRNMFA